MTDELQDAFDLSAKLLHDRLKNSPDSELLSLFGDIRAFMNSFIEKFGDDFDKQRFKSIVYNGFYTEDTAMEEFYAAKLSC